MKQAIAKGAVMDGAVQVSRAVARADQRPHSRASAGAGGLGLVAMAIATTFSFDIALIQRANLERKDYNAAWTLNVLIGAGCARNPSKSAGATKRRSW